MSSRHTEKRRIKAFDLTADNLPLKGVTSNLFIMMVKWMLVDGVLGGRKDNFYVIIFTSVIMCLLLCLHMHLKPLLNLLVNFDLDVFSGL